MPDKEYIEWCIDRYSQSMIRAAYSVLGSISESEDVVQEVFIKLYTQKPQFNDDTHEKAWLLRVTVNHAKNRLRRLIRLCPYEDAADTAIFQTDEQRYIYEAVRALEEKYRLPIHLHYYEGYTIREIAEILKIPASTAGTRLERAKEKLKKLLNTEG